MVLMEPITSHYVENDSKEINEIIKAENKYNITSNQNHLFNIILKNLSTSIEMIASYQDKDELKIFSEKYSLNKLKENKFLSICDSIDEIYEELLLEFSKNNSIILEDNNQINLKIPIVHAKFKELSFILNKKIKTDKEMCKELYKMVFDLREQIKNNEKENNDRINICNREINDLKETIHILKTKMQKLEENNKNLIENNKNLIEKINLFQKEISDLKNDKAFINEKIQTLPQQNKNILKKNNDYLKDIYEEIENPWTTEKDFGLKSFYYLLKDNNYYAEKNSSWICTIKSKHLFEMNKIYKLKYNINYREGTFRIGFGDFCEEDKRLKTQSTIGLTDSGLFIEGKKYKNIKIESKNKEIIFIINLKDNQKHFELFIDGKSYGTFDFTIDKIYGIAAFNFGSVTINTTRSLI